MVKTKRTQVHTAGTVEARHCNPAVLHHGCGLCTRIYLAAETKNIHRRIQLFSSLLKINASNKCFK